MSKGKTEVMGMVQLTKAERKTFLELLEEVKDHRKDNVGIVSILCNRRDVYRNGGFSRFHDFPVLREKNA
jgi:hypothetical protein